ERTGRGRDTGDRGRHVQAYGDGEGRVSGRRLCIELGAWAASIVRGGALTRIPERDRIGPPSSDRVNGDVVFGGLPTAVAVGWHQCVSGLARRVTEVGV